MGSISLTPPASSLPRRCSKTSASLSVTGDRVGLVAGNGGGKTTLLRCIAGRQELSSGEIIRSRGLRIGYVEQDVPPALHG